MAYLKIALANLYRNEGQWGITPGDRGGETFKGIARNIWPQWPGWKRIDLAKGSIGRPPRFGSREYFNWISTLDRRLAPDTDLLSMVEDFYRQKFWVPAFDQIKSQQVVNLVFGWDVNCGPSWGVKWLQKALGVPSDGKIGSDTLEAIETRTADNAGELNLINALRQEAKAHYYAIVAHDPTQQKFLKGWLSRV
jgi:lysozyme family protein